MIIMLKLSKTRDSQTKSIYSLNQYFISNIITKAALVVYCAMN